MDKQYLNDEFNRFFEFTTEDKSQVSSVSAKLFAKHIAYPLERELEKLRQRVAELEKERDKATQYWQIAEGRCDALMKQRFKDAAEYNKRRADDALVEAAIMAVEMIEYNKHERRHVRRQLNDAIASVKEK